MILDHFDILHHFDLFERLFTSSEWPCRIFRDPTDPALKPLLLDGNVTRNGKSTTDLDKSDMVAMGYINKTMMELVAKAANDDEHAKNRNVSFSQIITIQ